MYELMLTHSERMAIDWVGYRYAHGEEMYSVLTEGDPEQHEKWEMDQDILFSLPEWAAWSIRDIGEEDNFLWTCFSPEFAQKMNDFCDKIV